MLAQTPLPQRCRLKTMRMEVLGLDPQYSFYTVLAGLSGRSNLDRIPVLVLAFCFVIPNKILSEHNAMRLRLRIDIAVTVSMAVIGVYLWRSPESRWYGMALLGNSLHPTRSEPLWSLNSAVIRPANALGISRVVGENLEVVAVEAVQSIWGAKPHKALIVLHNGAGVGFRRPRRWCRSAQTGRWLHRYGQPKETTADSAPMPGLTYCTPKEAAEGGGPRAGGGSSH
jgi:hypothetical protein